MKDWRTILIQYLLQQNRILTGEDKTIAGASVCNGGMPSLTDLAVMMWIDTLVLVFGLREFITLVYGPVMSYGLADFLQKQEFSALCQPGLSGGLFSAELAGRTGAEKTGKRW